MELNKNKIVSFVVIALTIGYCLSLLYWREDEFVCSHGLIQTNPNRKWHNILLYLDVFCMAEMKIKDKGLKWFAVSMQAVMGALIFNEYSQAREDWQINEYLNFYAGILITFFTVKYAHKLNNLFTFIKNKNECK